MLPFAIPLLVGAGFVVLAIFGDDPGTLTAHPVLGAAVLLLFAGFAAHLARRRYPLTTAPPSGSTERTGAAMPAEGQPTGHAAPATMTGMFQTPRRRFLFSAAVVLSLMAMIPIVNDSGAPTRLKDAANIFLGVAFLGACGYCLLCGLEWRNARGGTHNEADRVRPPTPVGPQAAQARASRGYWPGRHEKPVPALIVKLPRERLTELIGSLFMSGLVAPLACCVIIVLESHFTRRGSPPRPEQCAWLILASIVGSWAVLVPSKFWEGVWGDPWPRRLLLMAIGTGVGAIACLLADVLLVRLAPGAGLPVALNYRPPPAFYAHDGNPLPLAFMASFGTLFLFVRFWRLADPLRRRRIRLWLVLLHVCVGGVVAAVVAIPATLVADGRRGHLRVRPIVESLGAATEQVRKASDAITQ